MSTSQPGKYVDPGNVRDEETKAKYLRILEEGYDPFEIEHFFKNHRHPLEFQNENWFVTKNFNPYPGAETHLLLVHKEFITLPTEISPEGWKDFQEAISWANKKYGIDAGALVMRYGDTTQTGASVMHLHAHIIVPIREEGVRKSIFPTINRVGE